MLRDSKLAARRLSPLGRALVVGAVLVCGLLVAGLRGPAGPRQAIALDAAQPKEARAEVIDLSWVPSDAVMIAALRPAALFRRPELAGLRELLNTRGGFLEDQMLPVEKIEQLTYVLLHQPDPTRRGPAAFGEPVFILRLAEPDEVEALIETDLPGSTAKEYQDATYHVSSKAGMAAFQPDERTLIGGTEPDIQNVIRSRGGPLPKIIGGRKTWRAFRTDHALLAVDASLLKTFFTKMRPTGALTPLAPLWDDTSTVVLGAHVDDRVRLHAVATSDDQQKATRVEETVKAVQVLARNFMRELQDRAPQFPESEQAWIPSALRTLELAVNAQVDREGDVVRAETSGGLSSLELGSLGRAFVDARDAASRAQSTNHLKQIAIAMHNYHDTNKRFPPAVLYGPDGKTPYSWRVALLPYLDQEALYREYRFDEPWDGPNNRRLAETVVAVYRAPTDAPGSANTSYFALVGPGTVFEGKQGTRIAEIRDGTSNTIMIVEAKRPVPWSKPEDIPYDPEKPLPELGGHFEGGFLAALCDGSVRLLAKSIDEKVLRGLISKAGNEPPPWRRPAPQYATPPPPPRGALER